MGCTSSKTKEQDGASASLRDHVDGGGQAPRCLSCGGDGCSLCSGQRPKAPTVSTTAPEGQVSSARGQGAERGNEGGSAVTEEADLDTRATRGGARAPGPAEELSPAPPSDAPDPEVLALIEAWISKQPDLKVVRRASRDKVADAVGAETLTYEKVVLADSSIFEGQLRGEDRHGWGRFTWDDGGAYEGQFDGNDMHGQGTYRWADGSVYSGVWTRNQMGPSGAMTWTDGRKYTGEFIDGKKHGEGKIAWPDGRAYSGQWRSSKQHGFGITVHSNGRERMSEWQNGSLVRWIDGREDYDQGKQREELSRREQLAER